MPRPLLLLAGAALLVASPFIYGGVRVLVDPEYAAQMRARVEANAELEAQAKAEASPTAAAPEAPPTFPASLPPGATAQWLLDTRLLRVEAGAIVGDAARFAGFNAADAARLFENLRAHAKSAPAPERENARKLEVTVFAWLSHLPPDPRRAFCDAVGAVHPPSSTTDRGYHGPFTQLFYHQASGPDSIFALAVQRYAAVLSDREVVDALKDFRVIDEALGDDSRWFLHVDERMQDFAPATLLALRDAISGYTGLGDRKYLRAQLQELAEDKASSPDQ